jgi:hypothetical protein
MTNPWSGWSNQSPTRKQRTTMYKQCGKKCFLGSRKSFPICSKNTCSINKKGVYAAYIRSRQYRKKGSKYYKISRKAKKLLKTVH